MSENKLSTLFQQSTEMYKIDNYQICIALLNDCLLLSPKSPILYSNRAISQFHMHQKFEAFRDLSSSIQLDHLNYIAYFNLFSLNFVTNNHEAAFENLCLSLSSIYTALARREKTMSNTNRAIYYAFNNKEALAMQGLLHLHRQEQGESIQFIEKVLNYESDLQIRKVMIKILSELNIKKKRQVNIDNQKLISGDKYKMETNIEYSNKNQLSPLVDEMIREFNVVYNKLQKINEKSQQSLRQEERQKGSLGLQNERSTGSSVKDDNQTNNLTAYNSLVINNQSQNRLRDHDSSLNTDKTHSEFNSSSRQAKECYQLNQISIINNPVQEKHTTNSQSNSNNSTDMHRKQVEKRMLINFRVYYAQILPEQLLQLNRVYVVLKYFLKQNQIVITQTTRNQKGICQWDDIESALRLADKQSNLQVKIFNKDYTKFQDQLVGRGEIQIGQLGVANVPLFNRRKCHIGNIFIGVQLNR